MKPKRTAKRAAKPSDAKSACAASSINPLVSAAEIQRGREILGEEAAGKTDAQVSEIVAGVNTIADMVIDCYIEQQRKRRQQLQQQAQQGK